MILPERSGHQVDQAADAKAAERSIGRRRPDAILMDMGLCPGKDGFTLTRGAHPRPPYRPYTSPRRHLARYEGEMSRGQEKQDAERILPSRSIARNCCAEVHGLLTDSSEKGTA